MELMNAEVLEEVPANECFPQPANSRKSIAAKDSLELGGGVDKEINAVGWRDRSFALGLDGDELAYLGSEAQRTTRLLLGCVGRTVLTKARRVRRSRIWDGGTGGIPVEKTGC